MKLGKKITTSSIISQRDDRGGCGEIKLSPYDATIPRVTENVYMAGRHQLYFDPSDPYGNGFTLR